MMDKDFELQGEAAERPEPKKLTAADIPKDYGWAAVDKDGSAWAFSRKPERRDRSWIRLDGDITLLGKNFDPNDWQDSLVCRETAEQPLPKKLTAADIPEGFSYAAVNKNGSGYAFKKRPLLSGLFWAGDCEIDGYEFLGGFDSSDWVNSLVIRETSEQQAAEPAALKDQENKPSFLEIDPNFLEAIAWRMTSNKGKYPPNNWQRPHDLLLDVDAIYRHLNDIKRQLEGSKSLTGESIQKHCAAIACNAMFLFYHTQEDQWQRAARSRQSNASQI